MQMNGGINLILQLMKIIKVVLQSSQYYIAFMLAIFPAYYYG